MVSWEDPLNFEERKRDHIRLALSEENQARGCSGLESVSLIHESLPELDFNEIKIDTSSLGHVFKSPFFISSMTAGHPEGVQLNSLLARISAEKGWIMGVGSQRRQLMDREMDQEWSLIRKQAPGLMLLGNLGLSQIRDLPVDRIQRMVESTQALGMIIHTNPLQECLQREGTPHFRGGLAALERVCRSLSVPVLIKETGCGFSARTLERLRNVGLSAVDVSGLGGTHWGRIEGGRSEEGSLQQRAAQTFWNWGVSTIESLREALQLKLPFEIWASGGVRSGLDGAKLLAMGAQMVGVAQPILAAALKGENELRQEMDRLEYELKVAMFCTGCSDLTLLKSKGIWRWVQK